MQEMIGLVLNIFLQMNELESLDFQLNQIERLLVVYPALNAMVTHFQKVPTHPRTFRAYLTCTHDGSPG
jgi:hypothetical protein